MLFLPAILQSQPEAKIISVVNKLLNLLDVQVTRSSLRSNLIEHPDYPSLLSICDVLTGWKVENVSIAADDSMLNKIPLPCLVQMNRESGAYLTILKDVENTEVHIYDSDKDNWSRIPRQVFNESWTRTVTLLHASKESGEQDFKNIRRKELLSSLMPAIGIGIVLLAIILGTIYNWFIRGSAAIAPSILVILKLIGVYITGLLLWSDVDKNNQTIQKVCKSGKTINCQAVLQSKHAKLFGMFSWGEIGFVYFLGSLSILMISAFNPTFVNLAGIMSFIVLPYVLFSIIYQWKIIKQWCILCLLVQGILVSEAITSICAGNYLITAISAVSFYEWIGFTLCFIIPFILWQLIKPVLIQRSQGVQYKNELMRMKRSPQIFGALLAKSKQIDHITEGLGLILGNPNASTRLIKVCNPYCGPCANAHPEINQLLNINSDLLVQIIFTASDKENDLKAPPVKHLLAIAERNDPALLEQALDDWYNAPEKSYEIFAAKYPMNDDLNRQSHKLRSMSEWCKSTQITFTPTFFVNGRQLPEQYSIGDLKYFIELV